MDKLSRAMCLSPADPGPAVAPGTVAVLVHEEGIGFLGLTALHEQSGDIWPRWQGDHMPDQLRRRIAQHILPDRDLMVS